MAAEINWTKNYKRKYDDKYLTFLHAVDQRRYDPGIHLGQHMANRLKVRGADLAS